MVCLLLLPPACAAALQGYKTVCVWRLAAAAGAQRGSGTLLAARRPPSWLGSGGPSLLTKPLFVCQQLAWRRGQASPLHHRREVGGHRKTAAQSGDGFLLPLQNAQTVSTRAKFTGRKFVDASFKM